MNCYCLFCEPGKARFVVAFLKALFSCEAISPIQVQHTRIRGAAADRERELMPGYVFVYSETPLDGTRLRRIQDVLTCLRSTDRKYELRGQDEAFAMMLYRNGGRLGKTQVYQEGDRIRIRDGAFEGVQAEILKVDRRYTRMQIEIPFSNRKILTWVEYELVEPAAAREEKTEPAADQNKTEEGHEAGYGNGNK